MGCDIHMVVEARWVDGKWHRIDRSWSCNDCDGRGRRGDGAECWHCRGTGQQGEFYDGRHYLLFSVLADVRNFHAFPVRPIHAVRGVPVDADPLTVEWFTDQNFHSRSWATLAELLAYEWGALPERWCDHFRDRLQLLREVGGDDDVRLVYAFDN
jgi:hypothetical protein